MKPIEIKKQLIKKLNKIIKLKFKYYGPKNNYFKYFTLQKNISHSIVFSESDKISNASKIKSIIILKKKKSIT